MSKKRTASLQILIVHSLNILHIFETVITAKTLKSTWCVKDNQHSQLRISKVTTKKHKIPLIFSQ